MEHDAKGNGVRVGGKYYSRHHMCRQGLINGLNETGRGLDRFRCVEVEINRNEIKNIGFRRHCGDVWYQFCERLQVCPGERVVIRL